MIAVDTDILARFYCDDPADPEAAKQRPRARRVMLDSSAVFVPLTGIAKDLISPTPFTGRAVERAARLSPSTTEASLELATATVGYRLGRSRVALALTARDGLTKLHRPMGP